MKIHTSLLMIMLLCIPSVLLAEGENKLERTFVLDRDGKVYLEFRKGTIEVNTWGRNEVRIVTHKDASLDVSHTKENIRISANRPQAHYALFIPDMAHLRVETISGSVKAKEIGGAVDIRTTSGDIEVLAAKNGASCKTVSGDIQMGKVTGNADLKTTSGKITAENINGSIKADTVSGNIQIEAFSHADEVEIESISGNIKLHGELSPGGIYKIDSHSGNIEIELPSGSNFELRTETFHGNIDCDFELRLSGKIDRKIIQGITGKGGARLSVSSFSGKIRVKKR
ncbi:MAG: hypothetical protein C4519_02750 [Desulfobacteraceae bacterium]|nr:MAG: hypothetical protein C4519_02750 [Desulfobacteraceae bacterium]